MRPMILIATGFILLLGDNACGAKVSSSPIHSAAPTLGECATDGYESYLGTGGAIPDGNVDGVTFGPVSTVDDGQSISDAVLNAGVTHPWVGDLNLDLSYDVTCDGQPDMVVRVLCRPNHTSCGGTSGFGCSDPLDGDYRFSDDGTSLVSEDCGSGTQPSGCYAPYEALSAFEGMAKGGCFRLVASDNASFDVGLVGAWTVWLASSAQTPTLPVSWGRIKASF